MDATFWVFVTIAILTVIVWFAQIEASKHLFVEYVEWEMNNERRTIRRELEETHAVLAKFEIKISKR